MVARRNGILEQLFQAAAPILDRGGRCVILAHIADIQRRWPPVRGFSVRRLSVRGLPVRFALRLGVVLILSSWFGASLAQKLVDPNAVAPEFRALAEKRRAEQIKLFECSKKADQARVLHRDRAAFVDQCLDK
jgi:hypothetical protein